jgi:hypothetical protein
MLVTPLEDRKPVAPHSHGVAAANRNRVPEFAKHLALQCGLTAYFLQQSRADQKGQYQGSLDFYWAKEASANAATQIIEPKHLIVMNDVDYYLNMAEFTLQHPNPMLLSTIEPTTPAGKVDDGVFRFEKNMFEMRVSGGGTYHHPLHNYSTDQFSTFGFDFWSLSCRYVSYLVERRVTAPHRALVLLTPNVMYTGLSAILARWFLDAGELKRLEPLENGFNVINTLNGATATTSISVDGGWEAATIPLATDTILRGIAALSKERKLGLQMATIESHLEVGGPRKQQAAILTPYYTRALRINNASFTYPVQYSVLPYRYATTYTPGIPSSLKPFGACLLGPTPAPDQCRENDERTVEERVTAVATPSLTPSRFVLSCIDEFVTELIPEAHKLMPMEVDEVFDRQARPTQRLILLIASLAGKAYSQLVKCFQKREAAGGLSDPRNISGVCGPDKLRYSAYMYAFSEAILKPQPWYAFSKTPLAVAQRVADIASLAMRLLMSDFRRMDGHVSNIGRLATKAAALRAFSPEFHEELNKLLESQYGRRAVTTFGVFFDTLFSRLSGSPETSAFNTFENALIAYMAKRMEIHPVTGVYYTHVQAWDFLVKNGFFGGDDGLLADTSTAAFSKAAKLLGHETTGEVVERGERGVNFLARYYSAEVWQGRLDSCTDIMRAAYKFMAASNLPDTITPVEKLMEKCRSACTTDANTPIIGDIARRALVVGTRVKTNSSGDTTWWAKYDAAEQYPNDNGDGWMDLEVAFQLPTFDLAAFRANVAKASNPESLLELPLCMLNPIFPVAKPGSVVPDGFGPPAVRNVGLDLRRVFIRSLAFGVDNFRDRLTGEECVALSDCVRLCGKQPERGTAVPPKAPSKRTKRRVKRGSE